MRSLVESAGGAFPLTSLVDQRQGQGGSDDPGGVIADAAGM